MPLKLRRQVETLRKLMSSSRLMTAEDLTSLSFRMILRFELRRGSPPLEKIVFFSLLDGNPLSGIAQKLKLSTTAITEIRKSLLEKIKNAVPRT